jgi:LDH2 family malate/lactate/ureidoglycolate dehydrogenase
MNHERCFDEVVYPGELEARNHETNTRLRIKLPEDTMADLRKLAVETGLKLPF